MLESHNLTEALNNDFGGGQNNLEVIKKNFSVDKRDINSGTSCSLITSTKHIAIFAVYRVVFFAIVHRLDKFWHLLLWRAVRWLLRLSRLSQCWRAMPYCSAASVYRPSRKYFFAFTLARLNSWEGACIYTAYNTYRAYQVQIMHTQAQNQRYLLFAV